MASTSQRGTSGRRHRRISTAVITVGLALLAAGCYPGYTDTVVGWGGKVGIGPGAPALQASMGPMGAAVRGDGRLYFCSDTNKVLAMVQPDGTYKVVAGTGADVNIDSGDGLPATRATINCGDFVVDDAGNVYLASSHRIRRIDASTGIITTWAGNGSAGTSGDGGSATAASFTVSGLAIDPSGNLYIADNDALRIRRVDSAGTISTVVNNNDLGAYTYANALDTDNQGNLFIATSHAQVVKATAGTWNLSLVAGTGLGGYSGDGGPATNAQFQDITAISVTATGDLFVNDWRNNRIRRIHDGIVTTAYGDGTTAALPPDGASAVGVPFSLWKGFVGGRDGSIYFQDTRNSRDILRRVDPGGILSTVVGYGTSLTRPGTKAVSTSAGFVTDVLALPDGSWLFNDPMTQTVRRVGVDGTVTNFAGNGLSGGTPPPPLTKVAADQWPIGTPIGLALAPNGDVYFADNRYSMVYKVLASDHSLVLVAGNGVGGYSGDGGRAVDAQLYRPTGVAVADDGRVFIADTANYRVRAVSTSGVISTYAGATGYPGGFSGDGGPAANASLNLCGIQDTWANPLGNPLALSAQGDLLVSDGCNKRVRRIDRTTTAIDTVYIAPARTAGIVVDGSGHMYVSIDEVPAETGISEVRRVDLSDGSSVRVAGADSPGLAGDGGDAADVRLRNPRGLAITPAGSLLVADSANNRVRRITQIADAPGAP